MSNKINNLLNMELSKEIKRVEKYLNKLNVEKRKSKREKESKMIITIKEAFNAGDGSVPSK